MGNLKDVGVCDRLHPRTVFLSLISVGMLVGLLMSSCRPSNPVSPASSTETPNVAIAATATIRILSDATTSRLTPSPPVLKNTLEPPAMTLLPSEPPTLTPYATLTRAPAPESKQTTPVTATSTMIPGCLQREFDGDLLTLVTSNHGLSREFVPEDLVDIGQYLPLDVTLGYETQVREVILDQLVDMILDMKAAGLHPMILSAYRSYPAQAIAWKKWQEQNPDTASIVSAPPGFSEHQLGTTIDFGSPELGQIVGEEGIEFHTYFYKTSEGKWLEENAHRYGFTLSYPRNTLEQTGFYFEPWHYRYIGVELATRLFEDEIYLIKYLLEENPEPCIP